MSSNSAKSKTIYYETYPLGIWSVSKLCAIICLIIGIIGTITISIWYLIAFIILYWLAFSINIRYRCKMCEYYQEFCNNKIGLTAQQIFNFLPESDSMVIVVSLISYIVIIFPIIGGIYVLITSMATGVNIYAIVFLVIYLIALIIPAYSLKKNYVAKYCNV
jgi:hypothetical protein